MRDDVRVLAEKCIAFADTDFREQYLEHVRELLTMKPEVTGDEFKAYCVKKGLRLPVGHHHNVWVSCVPALEKMGWIEFVKKVNPLQIHNHMESVSLWRSMLYDKSVTTNLEELLA